MSYFSRTAVILLVLGLSACVSAPVKQPPRTHSNLELYLPGEFKAGSEVNYFERAGYKIAFEQFPAQSDSSSYRSIPLPGGIKPLDRAGVLGRDVTIGDQQIEVPEARALHHFTAVKDGKTALNGLCIGDLDLTDVGQETRVRLLGAEQASKTYGKNLFSCFLIGSDGRQFQLVMVNNFAIGGFTRGLLTDGQRWFKVKNLHNLVDANGTKLYKGYNMVGYQVENDNEVLSALRIFNSYKVWLRKDLDPQLKQAMSATMAVLNNNYNLQYRGAVVSRNTTPLGGER